MADSESEHRVAKPVELAGDEVGVEVNDFAALEEEGWMRGTRKPHLVG